MLNKSFHPDDLGQAPLSGIIDSLDRLRQDFSRHGIPYHLDGEFEPGLGPRPRLWEYASAIGYSNLTPQMKILDAGCAYSILTPWLAKEGHQVWANDRTPYVFQRLAQMKHLGLDFNLDLYDLVKTGYPDEFFDRIFCISVLEHIPDRSLTKALIELNRILKIDGLLVMTFDLFQKHIPYGTGFFHGAEHCRYFSADSATQTLVQNTGFELLEPGFQDDTDWQKPPVFGQYNFGRIFLKKTRAWPQARRLTVRPLRVAHVSYDFFHGGIQEQVQVAAQYSTNPLIEHYIFAFGDGPLRKRAIVHNVPHAVVGMDEIAAYCQAYRIDMVLAHAVNGTTPYEHRFVYDLYRQGIPVINQHYCSYAALYPDWLFEHIITNAASTKVFLPAATPTSVVPLAVNADLLACRLSRDECRKKWKVPSEAIVIGRLSRLEPTKMVEHTIRAMATIRKNSAQPCFFIIGGAEALLAVPGKYEKSLKDLAQTEGLPDLLFTGAIDFSPGNIEPDSLTEADARTTAIETELYKEELLNLMDINLAPTSFEGYGLIFTEPAYFGVPAVTYDHCANKETVAEGGIVVPFNDLNALTETSRLLIEKTELRSRLGRVARETVLRRNMPAQWSARLEEVLLKTAERLHRKEIETLRISRPVSKILLVHWIMFSERLKIAGRVLQEIGRSPWYYTKKFLAWIWRAKA